MENEPPTFNPPFETGAVLDELVFVMGGIIFFFSAPAPAPTPRALPATRGDIVAVVEAAVVDVVVLEVTFLLGDRSEVICFGGVAGIFSTLSPGVCLYRFI